MKGQLLPRPDAALAAPTGQAKTEPAPKLADTQPHAPYQPEVSPELAATQAHARDEFDLERAAAPGRPLSATGRWGWLPLLSLIGAAGLLLISTGDFLARSGSGRGELPFWGGLLMLVAPVALRLTSQAAARRERIGLIVFLGLGLYLVKFMNSPSGFTYADEFVHLYNSETVLQTGQLFGLNTILPVTPLYPGLASVSAALAGLTGWPLFQTGLVIIGAARLVITLALYLLYEQVSGSPRVAGLAALIYTANSNYMFFSASFSYESLALPLVILVLFAVARREQTPQLSERVGLSLVAFLGICGVVVTHHLSAYFVVAVLCIWELGVLVQPYLAWVRRRIRLRRPEPGRPGFRAGPKELAPIALIGTLAWLALVAPYTVTYLMPVIRGAADSTITWLAGGSGARELFRSTSGYAAPLWERVVGIGSVLICLGGLPFGLRASWQRYRHTVLAWLLGIGAVAYFATLPLRLVPKAWETGNRASVLMFIGLAFTLALGGLELWRPPRLPRLGRALFAVGAAIVFMGGLIAGWPPELRLAHPYEVAVGSARLEPQGLNVARWSASMLGTGNRVGADVANCRYMLAYGMQYPLCGSEWDMRLLLTAKSLVPGHLQLIRNEQLRYILIDRRLISQDAMAGYFFDATGGGPLPASALYAPEVYQKFNAEEHVSRILDSGDIVLYDTKALLNNVSNVK